MKNEEEEQQENTSVREEVGRGNNLNSRLFSRDLSYTNIFYGVK